MNKARREADTMSASGNQARDGLFACLTDRAIRPQIGMRSQFPCLDLFPEKIPLISGKEKLPA